MPRSLSYRILFVCSGNLCRSPLAEGLFRARLPERLASRVEVRSAGTLGIEGEPATAEARRVARELGADIDSHRSQGVSAELVAGSDLVLGMADEHVRQLRGAYPEHAHKIRSCSDAADVADPINCPVDTYRECGRVIEAEIRRLLPLIETSVLGGE